ncbi:MAG: hypothetical protein U0234_04875 [Sandaracinus sp.]
MRFALVALALLVPSLASAQATLPLTEVASSQVTVDGLLRDWGSISMTSVGSGDDASMRFALAYDTNGLYVGAEVHDDRMVRTAHPGDTEDAVIVTIALPHGRALSGVDVWLYAGQAGTSAAVVQVGAVGARRRSSPRGATVVEAPLTRGSGYTIEAFVPWSAIGARDRLEDGRGSVRLRDVDQSAHPAVEAEPALIAVDGAHLDQLLPLAPSNGETQQLRGFLEPRGLVATRPSHQWRIDVAEDATPEHVMVIDRFVVVVGPGYQGGTGYGFAELGISAVADLIHVEEPIDLTGDGHPELVVTLRQRGTTGSRDLFEVISLSSPSLTAIFDIEIRKETPQGSVDATARIVRGRGRGALPTLVTAAGEAHGLDASTLRESPSSDAQPMLLPWGPVAERTFRWDGHTFAAIGERPNPHYVDPAAAAAQASASSSATTASAPPAPGVDDLIAGFRREAGIGARVRPTFDLTANLAGNATVERALVFGNQLVVVGTEFQDGTGWFRYQLPCAAADLVSFTVADLTGEGRAELIFRIRQTLGDVRREVLLVHMFTPTDFPAVLTREVMREREGNRIENQVVTTGGHLEIRPGTATGWTQASWPFSDAAPTDGVEAPLLPWRDRAQTFRFDHGHLVAR